MMELVTIAISLTIFLIMIAQAPMVLLSERCSRQCLLASMMIFAISPLGGTTIITSTSSPPPVIMLDCLSRP